MVAWLVTITAGVSAHEDFPIQPGATALPAHPALGPYGVCTLNFLFVDASSAYVGTAGRCTYDVGERVAAPGLGEFGTVVYRTFSEPDDLTSLLPWFSDPDDVALIRIDTDMLVHASPVMRGIGAVPAGVVASNDTAPGDEVRLYGQGLVLSAAEATRARTAVLVAYEPRQYDIEVALTLGDSGAPLVHAETGKALGIVSALGVPSTLGPTLERILVLFAENGFPVRLAASVEEVQAVDRPPAPSPDPDAPASSSTTTAAAGGAAPTDARLPAPAAADAAVIPDDDARDAPWLGAIFVVGLVATCAWLRWRL